MKTKKIMIQGTASSVGKSLVVTALCRLLKDQGCPVAPFKAQNMSLNSFVTAEGGEMARAQVTQAEAAGVLPGVDMNPVLLKPLKGHYCQIILKGKLWKTVRAKDYVKHVPVLFRHALESLARLSQNYGSIVIEGAGSPVEINLRKQDFANMRLAVKSKTPVLLVADIDKGGALAAVVGTMQLLRPQERRQVKGVLFNKFRGDVALLMPGLRQLEKITKVPVIGVLPYLEDLNLEEEDSTFLHRVQPHGAIKNKISIAILKLPHLSNYSDFQVLAQEKALSVTYSLDPSKISRSAVIILPGSKNTIFDLKLLNRLGFKQHLALWERQGKTLIGFCGGYQMLGREVKDLQGYEGKNKKQPGFDLLPVTTIFTPRKKTHQVKVKCLVGKAYFKKGELLQGYEMHMGVTQRLNNAKALFDMTERSGVVGVGKEGCRNTSGSVWGTYVHGLFENNAFRQRFVQYLQIKHGVGVQSQAFDYQEEKEKTYDRLAEMLRKNLDLKALDTILDSSV